MQNVFWINMMLSQYYQDKGAFDRALEMLQKAVDQLNFYATKSYKVFHEKKIQNGQIGIPYLVCQNEVFYLSDYPIFSNALYE
jgi:hypothetical protein